MSILKTQKDEQEYKEMHNDLFYLLYETYQTYYTLLHYDNFIKDKKYGFYEKPVYKFNYHLTYVFKSNFIVNIYKLLLDDEKNRNHINNIIEHINSTAVNKVILPRVNAIQNLSEEIIKALKVLRHTKLAHDAKKKITAKINILELKYSLDLIRKEFDNLPYKLELNGMQFFSNELEKQIDKDCYIALKMLFNKK